MIYMDIAVDLAKRAAKYNEIPVGAVIVKKDKVIARGYNKREFLNNIISHAEINCIIKASKKLGTWKLNDCEMYVTLKPCSMCEAAIKQSRIKKVHYLLDKEDYKKEYNKTKIDKYENESLEKDYYKFLNEFFKNKR